MSRKSNHKLRQYFSNIRLAEFGVFFIMMSVLYSLALGAELVGFFSGLSMGYNLLSIMSEKAVIVFSVCSIIGLTLYILDRRGFLNRRRGSKIASASFAILGLTLIVLGVLDGAGSQSLRSLVQAHSPQPLSWEESKIFIFALFFNLLGFILGIVLLFDRGKMLETHDSR